MQQFRDYLAKEGLPDQENRLEFILPVIKNLGTVPLKMVRVNPDFNFKIQAPKLLLDPDHPLFKDRITLDWYPKVQARKSQDLCDKEDMAVRHEGKLEDLHFAFMDMEAIYQELQKFKAERGWHNFSITRDSLEALLKNPDWYRLYIPSEELAFTSFKKVRSWQELATTLLKKYCDKAYKAYKAYKSQCESEYLEIQEIQADDPNLVEEYRFLIDQSQEDIIATLEGIKADIENGTLHDVPFANFHSIDFSRHLYRPLICLDSNRIEVSPVQLNQGEKAFVLDLRTYYEKERAFFQDKELYLLRNQSRGRGIGFFEAGNFYPDFILWLVVKNHQYITFVDPKGLRNLQGENDPKIQFYRTIKKIESDLNDPLMTLNSFIISNTSYGEIEWWKKSKAELEKHHILFQEDSVTYLNKLILTLVDATTTSKQENS